MNKAFEKILDRLEDLREGLLTTNTEYDSHCVDAMMRAGQIVQEVAKEYKNGWIPCSERLPEEYKVLCCDKYGEIFVGHPYFEEESDTNYSAESDTEFMYSCIAWQPLPEPYEEKE